jgi:hypothetical protein
MKQITVSDNAYEYISQRAEQCGLSVEVWLTRYIGSMKSREAKRLSKSKLVAKRKATKRE